MSLIIVNCSEEKGIPYSRTGLQHYRVYLNNIPLVDFTHTSEMGMDVCLLKASEAVRLLGQEGIDEKIKLYKQAREKELLEIMMGLGELDQSMGLVDE